MVFGKHPRDTLPPETSLRFYVTSCRPAILLRFYVTTFTLGPEALFKYLFPETNRDDVIFYSTIWL